MADGFLNLGHWVVNCAGKSRILHTLWFKFTTTNTAFSSIIQMWKLGCCFSELPLLPNPWHSTGYWRSSTIDYPSGSSWFPSRPVCKAFLQLHLFVFFGGGSNPSRSSKCAIGIWQGGSSRRALASIVNISSGILRGGIWYITDAVMVFISFCSLLPYSRDYLSNTSCFNALRAPRRTSQ